MRIGLMLRSYDEKGGVGVYTRNLVKELLEINQEDHFVLYYRNPGNLGTFSGRANVTQRIIHAPNKALWDQVAIPWACTQDQIDLIFHPKFTAPLLAPCKVVMVVHGADWFIPEQAKYYNPLDVAYIRVAMPLYFRKCSLVISVSELTTKNFNEVLGLSPGKVRTIYFGPARHFKPVTDADQLHTVKQRYNLPQRYILTLTKRRGDRRKNLGGIIQAYAQYHQNEPDPIPLVIGGLDCHLFRDKYAIPQNGFGKDIIFPGWIQQADMPAVYSAASLFLYPSNLEAFPIPVTEAMACGIPILTSNVNGLKEIAGDGAMLVDPQDSSEIAQGICQILSDEALRGSYAARGLVRSKLFTWDLCASKTLAILKEVYSKGG